MEPLVTFGHGVAGRGELAPLLRDAGVRRVVDVRTVPGSRRNPDAGREALEEWLPAADSPDTFWRNDSFRGYAGHTRSPEFLAAMDDLLDEAEEAQARNGGKARTAVMCSESVWWRCHRRLIADFAVLVRGVPVVHLAHDGRLTEHPPTSGARLRDDGLLVYDGD